MTDLTVDDIHGSRAYLAWVDHSGRKFERTMVGNRAAQDGYEFPQATE